MKALTNKLLNGVFDIVQVKMADETRGQNLIRTTVALKFAQAWSFRDLPANVVAVGNPVASSGTYEVPCWESSPCACK